MSDWKSAPAVRPQRGVVGRVGSAAAFDLQRWAPSSAAAEFVEHFWSVSWDLAETESFDSTVITFPAVHLTHEWGTDSPRHGHALPATLIHGVVPEVFTTTIRGRGQVVGARFRAGGFAARFGRDAAQYTGRILAADAELFGAPVQLTDDRGQAAARLDELIAQNPTGPDPTYRALSALLDRLREDNDVQRVAQVMDLAPWSARTTQRVFRRYVGMPAKWVLCRYRLQQAALDIETEPGVDLADLAARLGWYDQAHFTNDFRAMLGCTPGQYAARHGLPAE
ncbi:MULTISPECIES: helix-turn-helix domain-containing protein [Mycolicibacterium]|uniref:helix-turn-helix domain-containing protein n=1 Tax=Mycolicibacterium TaxID=1866885 RepID=UPI000F846D0B|nr:helix-turn-helix domain-containing protein [Mycolicibacterium chitae]MCV7104416.1 AraC family transcriptional regulator [Mycolicibacterium chitae]